LIDQFPVNLEDFVLGGKEHRHVSLRKSLVGVLAALEHVATDFFDIPFTLRCSGRAKNEFAVAQRDVHTVPHSKADGLKDVHGHDHTLGLDDGNKRHV
jgi:hypothetical protein